MEITSEDKNGKTSSEVTSEISLPTKASAPMKVVRIMTFLNKENNKTYQVIQTVPQANEVPSNTVQDERKDSESSTQEHSNEESVAMPTLVPIKYVTKHVSFNCFKCKASYRSQSQVVKHIREVHSAGSSSEDAAAVVKEEPLDTSEDAEDAAAEEETYEAIVVPSAQIKKDFTVKSLHSCKICEASFDTAAILYEHYKETHEIDNPYLRGHTAQEPRTLRCDKCGVCFTKRSGLSRHRKNFHSENGPTGMCHHCGNRFKLSGLSIHEKKCLTKHGPRRRQKCFYQGCDKSYYRKEDLIKHVKDDHAMEIEPMRTLRFGNEEEFKKWKQAEEDRTFSYYSKHAGTKQNTKTYYCQHEGSERSHKGNFDTRETMKHNKKGRIKRGIVCTSYLRVKVTDNEVIARYYPTHSHPISQDDLKHQPLSKEIIKYIKDQIALNVPCRQIQVMAKKKLAEIGGMKRDTQISLKRITSMAQRYRQQQSLEDTIAPNVAVEAFNSFIDALCAQDDTPVLFYQPPSENAFLDGPNQEDHLFFLGLQTVDQQKMLQREKAMPMFISVTKAEYTFQYYLISIVVPCEDNFEYPVGHLMCSQLNEEVVSLFLQTIGERCPELNVNCIVSFDCQQINDAIKKVFGADGPYFLSKWHYLEYMRKEFLKTVPPNRSEELYDFILAMTEAENEERFLFLYNSFKEQFDSTFPDVVSDFAEYFVRAPAWATCYRIGTGMIDSCLYADSFFNKLNKKFRRRPSKSINLLPDLLLHMQESYRDRREGKEVHLDIDDLMREQHNLALEIPSDLVQEPLSRHWIVQASKHGQAFCVMECTPKCSENECQLTCKDCVGLCSHMYFCTCDRSESICLHVHKVHQLHGPTLEAEYGSEEAVSYLMEQDADGNGDGDVVGDGDVEDTNPPNDGNDTAALLVEAEAARENILKNLDSLRQVVDQRCVAEDMVSVINDTLESLCNLIGSS